MLASRGSYDGPLTLEGTVPMAGASPLHRQHRSFADPEISVYQVKAQQARSCIFPGGSDGSHFCRLGVLLLMVGGDLGGTSCRRCATLIGQQPASTPGHLVAGLVASLGCQSGLLHGPPRGGITGQLPCSTMGVSHAEGALAG